MYEKSNTNVDINMSKKKEDVAHGVPCVCDSRKKKEKIAHESRILTKR
jgi:hypothetical protein